MIRSIIWYFLVILVGFQGCGDFGSSNKPDQEEPLRLLWSFAYEGESGYSVASLRPELVKGSVVISPDRMIYRISQRDGSLEWKVPAVDSSMVSTKRLLFDFQYLYVKEDLGASLQALRLKDGQTVWESMLPEGGGSFYDLNTDAMSTDELYLTGRYGNMFVFNHQGDYRSSHRFAPSLQGLMTYQDRLLVAQGWKPDTSEVSVGQILALNPVIWDTVWTYQTNQGGFYYSAAVITDGIYYNGTAEGPGEFVALDAATGQVKWKLEGYWCYRFTLGDGKIFINDGNYILAVDRQTGKVLWKDYFQGHTESNLAYVDGYLYHAHNGGLFVWDAQTGKRVAGPIQPPDGSGFYNLNAAGGKVFVQSDFHLYAYRAYGQ